MSTKLKYSNEILEYVKTRYEQTNNITHISAEVRAKFELLDEVETVRRNLSNYINRHLRSKSKQPIKRLFFDIETSYFLVPVFQAHKQYVNANNFIREKKIICICYKWQYEDEVHTLVWDKKQDDAELVKKFIKVIAKADEIIAHNGDRFDMKELRTRAIMTGNLMFPIYRTLDTLKKARQYFRFPSNRLDYLGKVLNVGRKLDHEGMQMWIDIVEHKDKAHLQKMVDYCMQDVVLLEDVYFAMSPYIYHNTNFAVLKGGDKWDCPECASKNVQFSHMDATAMGYIKRHMKCNNCKKFYKISNRTYMAMLTDLMRVAD